MSLRDDDGNDGAEKPRDAAVNARGYSKKAEDYAAVNARGYSDEV